MVIDGRPYINFFGAGYLALSRLPEIRDAALRVLEQGSPFSRQLPASHGAIDRVFDTVEHLAAIACGTEATVYFATGYLISAVGLSSLKDTFDVLILDEYAHFSLVEAAKSSGVPTFRFAHCDSDSLAVELKRAVRGKKRPVVLSDGAFATTGRIPPLAEYAKCLAPYGGRLFVDESHAFGVVGENGRGAAEHCGVGDVAMIGTTLSKALCANGAVVACSTAAAGRLRSMPPLGAACAGSPVAAAAAAASLSYMARHPELRANLRALADYLRVRLRAIGIDTISSPAPIVAFRYGTQADMLALQRRAFDRGIYLHYSTYIGAGPDGMIRCGVFGDHTQEDVDFLIDVIR